MAFFIPSFFQKRILRYALSRLELLDTKNHNLDDLDVAWGKRSTVELRNVGMHIEKLAALLRLPQGLRLVKAQILLLRITVPADLYRNGILIEIDGIKIEYRLSDTEDHTGEQRQSLSSGTSTAERPKDLNKGKLRRTQFHVHDPGGVEEDREGKTPSEHLPTTIDLATSFLQTEPKEERVELQNAITQSQCLTPSESPNEETDMSFGVGGGVSLPGFIADFLKGVGDRVEISIRNADVNLAMEINLGSAISASSSSPKPEIITLQLFVQEIILQGSTANAPSNDSYSDKHVTELDQSSERFIHGQNTRHICLKNLRATTISDPTLFQNLSRFSVPPSPDLRHSSTKRKSDNVSFASTSSSGSPPSVSTFERRQSATVEDEDDDQAQDHYPLLGSENTTPDSDTEPNAGELEARGSLRTLMHEESQPQDDPLFESLRSNRVSARMADRQDPDERTVPGSFLDLSASESLQSIDKESDIGSKSRESEQSEGSDPLSLHPSPPLNRDLQSGQTSPQPESLAQSKLFSHEEAESMYMSAMSQAGSRVKLTEAAKPDNWESSNSDESQTNENPDAHEHETIEREPHNRQASFLRPGAMINATNAQRDPDLRHPIAGAYKGHAETQPAAADSVKAEHPRFRTHSTSSPRQCSSPTSEAGSDSGYVVKKILDVDSIDLELPSSTDVVDGDSTRPARTTQGNRIIPPPAGDRTSMSGLGKSNLQSATLEPHTWIRMMVGHVSIFGDINLTKLTLLIARRLGGLISPTSSEGGITAEKEVKHNRTAISVKRVTWQFLDAVRGISGSQVEKLGSSLKTGADSEDPEVLLKALLMKLKINITSNGVSSTSTFSVGKVVFGYAAENILSFDSGLKLRDSNRDFLASKDQDITLKIIESSDRRRVEVATLPLHIRLDLRRLDETFSWFGGFSSILGLGSSMISTVTVRDSKPKKNKSTKASRGVHFEIERQDSHLTETSERTQEKMNVRIGGVVFDLKGTSSAFRFETTAVKVVSRAEGVGLAVDRLNVTGPHAESVTEATSISAKILGLRVEYLPTPKDVDLARLLALLSPSNDKYNEQNDDILLETLFRQRRQGGVVRVTAEHVEGQILRVEDLYSLPALGDDLKKLSTVAKYLPEDDRPGIMTLVLFRQLHMQVTVDETLGQLEVALEHAEVAHITLPSLFALGLGKLSIIRNASEELVGEAEACVPGQDLPPMIMVRFVGNEMEPKVKVKLCNLRAEYHVYTVAAMMGSPETLAESNMKGRASSTATLTDEPRIVGSPPTLSARSSGISDSYLSSTKLLKIEMVLHDVILGLNPRDSPSRGLLVLTDTHLTYMMPKDEDVSAAVDVKKASFMAIDDHAIVNRSKFRTQYSTSDAQNTQVQRLSSMGYVSLCSVSAARTTIDITRSGSLSGRTIEVELRDLLLVIESCADSTQTLQTILNGLQLPQSPSQELKYRTEVVPVEDMLASFSGDAFVAQEQIQDNPPLELDEGDMVDEHVPQNIEFVSSFYNPVPETLDESTVSSMFEEDLQSSAIPSITRTSGDTPLLESFQEQYQVAPDGSTLNINENHFGNTSNVGGTAHRWNNQGNTYELTNESKLRASPFKLRVRDIHVIWNLFDGYDWQQTRDTINQAVAVVEEKAMEKRSKRDKRQSVDPEEENSVIGDFLFNSIYIGIPANRDPKELGRQISRNIDDLASETESSATSRESDSPSQPSHGHYSKRKVRLRRSKYHKLTFELKGASADMVMFPPQSGETQSSVDIRVQDLEIFDHVPTSTWKKFATYMHGTSERESGTSMIHLEILNVKPVPDLAASEIILKVSYLWNSLQSELTGS